MVVKISRHSVKSSAHLMLMPKTITGLVWSGPMMKSAKKHRPLDRVVYAMPYFFKVIYTTRGHSKQDIQ